nr:immunoglobulin heavy chain junction region [Macaca mulatta]MOW33010.1 immunoglobulin heavy chain junction region [Macaca mulatta]MOW33502.1 immunoglobulin heavy chain junction region [Macaca mulatta]
CAKYCSGMYCFGVGFDSW